MRRLPLVAHRIIAGLFLLLLAPVLVDNIGNYRWFWPNDRAALGVVILIGAIWAAYVGPLIPRMIAYQRRKDFEARSRLEARLRDESGS